MITPEFLVTTLIIVLLPGTGVLYTVSNGLLHGRRAAFFASAGCTAGIVPHLAASAAGLSAIMHSSAVVFQAVKYAGALYLLYLAWTMWRSESGFSVDQKSKDSEVRGRAIAVRAVLINLLNPKLTIFFFAFIPQFIPSESVHPSMDMLSLSLVFMILTFIVFFMYGIAAHAMGNFLSVKKRAVRIVTRSFSAVFALMGLKLALSDR